MILNLLTPQKSFLGLETLEVVLPAEKGESAILPGHARMVAGLTEGILTLRQSQQKQAYEIGPGFFEIRDEQIHVFTEFAKPLPA